MIRYAIVDTETSGLPRFDLPAEHESQPHVASIAIILATEGDDGVFAVESESVMLVKPDAWVMEEGAMKVNGLTMERLNADGIPLAIAVAPYVKAIDEGRVIVAHNAQFDCKMLRGALRRLGYDDRFERTLNACTMRAATDIMKMAPTDKSMAAGYKANKPPKLSEAHEFFVGEPLVDAHTALGDARACLAILKALRERGVDMSGAVHYAKEGTKAGKALAARKAAGEPAEKSA